MLDEIHQQGLLSTYAAACSLDQPSIASSFSELGPILALAWGPGQPRYFGVLSSHHGECPRPRGGFCASFFFMIRNNPLRHVDVSKRTNCFTTLPEALLRGRGRIATALLAPCSSLRLIYQ